MKKEKNQNKSQHLCGGITLVSLVITIIILLILAGVTISLTMGENGIFRLAEKASKNYIDAQNKEMQSISEYEQLINNNIDNSKSHAYEMNNMGYVKKIFNHVSTSVNYTYTVEEDGKYIAGLQYGNYNPVCNISTNGNIVLEHSNGNASWISGIKIIEAKKGDTITLTGTNFSSHNLTAFIYQLYNISTKEVVKSTFVADNTAQDIYTATSDNDKVLIISIANADNISMATNYTGVFNCSYVHSDNAYVDYAVLKKNASISISTYGYNWGGGAIYIIK